MVTSTMATLRRRKWTDLEPSLNGAQVRQSQAAEWFSAFDPMSKAAQSDVALVERGPRRCAPRIAIGYAARREGRGGQTSSMLSSVLVQVTHVFMRP
jgi:hypothetical protein